MAVSTRFEHKVADLLFDVIQNNESESVHGLLQWCDDLNEGMFVDMLNALDEEPDAPDREVTVDEMIAAYNTTGRDFEADYSDYCQAFLKCEATAVVEFFVELLMENAFPVPLSVIAKRRRPHSMVTATLTALGVTPRTVDGTQTITRAEVLQAIIDIDMEMPAVNALADQYHDEWKATTNGSSTASTHEARERLEAVEAVRIELLSLLG